MINEIAHFLFMVVPIVPDIREMSVIISINWSWVWWVVVWGFCRATAGSKAKEEAKERLLLERTVVQYMYWLLESCFRRLYSIRWKSVKESVSNKTELHFSCLNQNELKQKVSWSNLIYQKILSRTKCSESKSCT